MWHKRLQMVSGLQIQIDNKRLAELCQKWKIKELSLFGSVLRKDFGPQSDVDVLVSFFPDAHWSLFDFAKLQKDLEKLIGREVDLVSRRAIEASRNPIRREAILSSSVVLHAA